MKVPRYTFKIYFKTMRKLNMRVIPDTKTSK